MKREIKFRGFNAKTKKWKYGYLIAEGYHCLIWSEDIPVPVVFESVGQFTGFKDYNDIEIYEGDLLESKIWRFDEPLQILFDYGSFYFATVKGYKKADSLEEFLKPNDYVAHICNVEKAEAEIVGNIYENPELLQPVKNSDFVEL